MGKILDYDIGTVSVSSGDTIVTGHDVLWVAGNAKAGDDLMIGGHTVMIVDVIDQYHLEIYPWPYGDIVDSEYRIVMRGPLRFAGVEAALEVSKLVTFLNAEGLYLYVPSDATGPAAIKKTADEGQYAFQATTGKLWLMEGGFWVYIGIYKGVSPKGPWDSATDYAANDLVSYGGSSYLAVASNTNEPPPSANWMMVAEKGEIGATGAPGTNGTNGIDGAAATIEIGTVTTVPYGTPASVNNVGDENAAVLDFAIPAGQDGTGTGDMQAANNLSDLVDPDTALDNLGGTTVGKAVLTAVDQAAARGVIAAATSDLSNISFAVSANAGALTIALKDGAGNDPSPTNLIAINFRSATQTSGLRSLLTLTAAQSITVPATSTLGFQSATAGRIWITGWDDGGTFRLGVFNASDANNVYPLSEEGVASSVQVVAAGNAVGQHYTAGAAVASKAFRTLGYIEWNASGMTTAGTWTTTNLASIQTFGTGVRKPGDVVHRRSVKSWNALGYLTTTSNVYQNHPYLQQSIFLSSAANLVRAVCSTTSKQTVAQGGCWSRITRGGSGNAVGAETLAQDNTSAAAVAPVLIGGGYDKPNATSTTYYAQARSNVNGNQITFGEFGFSVLELEEIQG